MKSTKLLFLFALLIAINSTAVCQERFTNCTAAYLDNIMVVDDYSPTGHCEIAISAKGQLTVQTMNDTMPTGKIKFKIAIRNGATKTLISYSDKSYESVEIKKILQKCVPGDAIVLMTLNDRYALPHNEILVK